jgi:hypothetical protein
MHTVAHCGSPMLGFSALSGSHDALPLVTLYGFHHSATLEQVAFPSY